MSRIGDSLLFTPKELHIKAQGALRYTSRPEAHSGKNFNALWQGFSLFSCLLRLILSFVLIRGNPCPTQHLNRLLTVICVSCGRFVFNESLDSVSPSSQGNYPVASAFVKSPSYGISIFTGLIDFPWFIPSGAFMRPYIASLLPLFCISCQALYPRQGGNPPEVVLASFVEDMEIKPVEEDCLALAAKHIEEGDQASAVPYMQKHIEKFPDQIMIRAYLAELLVKIKRLPDARSHFETFIADAQQTDSPAKNHLVHCHTRLMEIAQENDDDYSEHLHRGIGLYLLTKQQDLFEEVRDPTLTQQLLVKAIRELDEAKQLRPNEARPYWYLYESWTMLDQPRPAGKALQEAQANCFFSKLTPKELQELRVACMLRETSVPAKK
jgi:hypothetical protein